MKAFKNYLLPMIMTMALFFVSCSKEDEMWETTKETETWEFELRNIVSDLGFLFDNSCVKFLQAEKINHKVDSTDFFNDDTFYPVCFKNLYNFFTLKKQDYVMTDTNTVHIPGFAMKRIAANVIDNQYKYDLIKLTWLYCGDTFTTVAAFDKTNGQIVYDNSLTNIPLFQTEIPSRKSKLTRAEGGNGNVETRVFYKDRLTLDHQGYYFDYRVKCLCKVTCYDNGIYVLMNFDSIESQLSSPDYPNGMFNPVANVVVYSGNIIYFLWLGENGKNFSSYYSSDDPTTNAYNIWYDVNHGNKHGKCDAKSVSFYNNLTSGLYAPDLGWNF